MKLNLTITAETGRAYVPFLRARLRAAHGVLVAWASRPSSTAKQLGRERAGGAPKPRMKQRQSEAIAALHDMSLVLVGDRRMGALHAQFMGIAGPTDVLTFPMEEDGFGRIESGEVIVCVPEAARQAKIRKSRTELELLLYSIHGMLHLLGYDDTTDRAYATMHSTEDAILTQIGLGPVFAPPASRKGGRR